jgi:hypothetical protein
MWMMLWSLSALLVDHGRRSAPPPSPPSIALPSPLLIAVERPVDLPAGVAEHTLEEAAAIWRPLGVGITWMFVDAGDDCTSPDTLHLVFTNAPASADAGVPLGWIQFVAPTMPGHVVHLSREAAQRLLASSPTLRQKPQDWQNMLLARVMGRALAHELGHYLLASKQHSSHGLMRPSLPLDALTDPERVGFELSS